MQHRDTNYLYGSSFGLHFQSRNPCLKQFETHHVPLNCLVLLPIVPIDILVHPRNSFFSAAWREEGRGNWGPRERTSRDGINVEIVIEGEEVCGWAWPWSGEMPLTVTRGNPCRVPASIQVLSKRPSPALPPRGRSKIRLSTRGNWNAADFDPAAVNKFLGDRLQLPRTSIRPLSFSLLRK